MSKPANRCSSPLPGCIVTLMICGLFVTGIAESTERKRQRFEIASLFHPADPYFGGQLDAFLDIVKTRADGKFRLRRSRKAPGYSAMQIVQSLNAGSVDAVLLDPVGLGYRPAIAQLFGGIPFGPTASKVVAWADSETGRTTLDDGFSAIGVKALLCGHSKRISGVFSREEILWPGASGSRTIHSQGLANEVYESLGIVTRPLPAGDLYMGYASGVVDLLVSLHPVLDARAGYAQLSGYFYYPSWERNSSFAMLLVSLKKWDSMSSDNQLIMTGACQSLNNRQMNVDTTVAINSIAEQGNNDTVVVPWPTGFLQAARQAWVESASKLAGRHPVFEPVFKSLNIPGVAMD